MDKFEWQKPKKHHNLTWHSTQTVEVYVKYKSIDKKIEFCRKKKQIKISKFTLIRVTLLFYGEKV